jgi:hypothetical protein
VSTASNWPWHRSDRQPLERQIRNPGHAADRCVTRVRPAGDTVQNPGKHSQVFAESRPQERAIRRLLTFVPFSIADTVPRRASAALLMAAEALYYLDAQSQPQGPLPAMRWLVRGAERCSQASLCTDASVGLRHGGVLARSAAQTWRGMKAHPRGFRSSSCSAAAALHRQRRDCCSPGCRALLRAAARTQTGAARVSGRDGAPRGGGATRHTENPVR